MAETNGASVSSENKARTFKCKDCKIKFADVYAYTEHLESKAHIKGVMKNKYGEKYLEAKEKLNSNSLVEKPATEKNIVKPTVTNDVKLAVINGEKPKVKNEVKSSDSDPSSSSEEDEDVYPCEVCKKVCTGYLSYKLHLEGRKHNKMVKKTQLLSEMKKQQILPTPGDQPKEESLLDKIMPKKHFASSDIVCQVCNKSCTGPEVYKQHCKSKAHIKKLLTQDVVKEIDSLGLSPTPKQSKEESFHCKVCEKGFSGPIPYIQHLESTAHLKQAKQVEERGKIKDLIISSEEDSKFQCKECGKMFSGPIPFNAHLNSSIHGKLKKKSALLENLEAEHPELFKAAPGEDDSDSDVVLGCEVCHIAFSGPEVAKDHFGSLKHKKAVKKRAQFQKYKRQVKQKNLLETKPVVKQRSVFGVDSEHSDSDEFDIISNPESCDAKH